MTEPAVITLEPGSPIKCPKCGHEDRHPIEYGKNVVVKKISNIQCPGCQHVFSVEFTHDS
jgi:transposase-like protein